MVFGLVPSEDVLKLAERVTLTFWNFVNDVDGGKVRVEVSCRSSLGDKEIHNGGGGNSCVHAESFAAVPKSKGPPDAKTADAAVG